MFGAFFLVVVCVCFVVGVVACTVAIGKILLKIESRLQYVASRGNAHR